MVKFSETLVAEIAEVLSCEKAFGNRVACDKLATPPTSARQKSRRLACIIPDAPLTKTIGDIILSVRQTRQSEMYVQGVSTRKREGDY
jgi:hypothetical protein